MVPESARGPVLGNHLFLARLVCVCAKSRHSHSKEQVSPGRPFEAGAQKTEVQVQDPESAHEKKLSNSGFF